MIQKIATKIMRTITIFQFSRIMAIWLVRLVPKQKLTGIENDDIFFNIGKIVKEIENKGFSDLLSISEKRLNSIIKFSNSTFFQDLESKEKFKINYEEPRRPSNSLWYTNGSVIECSAIKELVYDENTLEIARKYLGNEPTIKDVRMWWSFPPDTKNYNQLYGFHYDIDALKFLKLFIYITDVDENSGPHVIVSKTHLTKTFFEKRNRRMSDKQVIERFGSERINVMTAQKGTGFFEDTFAYHKGTTPNKPRLILQIEYAI